mgnify:CR=1 FL=1
MQAWIEQSRSELATPADRIMAGLLDLGMIAVICALYLYTPVGRVLATLLRTGPWFMDWFAAPIVAVTMIFVSFQTVFNCIGASPGRFLMRIRVVREDGLSPGLARGIARSCLDIMVPLFLLGTYLILLWGKMEHEMNNPDASFIMVWWIFGSPVILAGWITVMAIGVFDVSRLPLYDRAAGTHVVRNSD